MAIYCADFVSHPTDWVSPPGSYESMHGDPLAPCSRAWVFITTPEFKQLAQVGSPSVTPPVYALSVADGAELAWLIGGAWALAYAARLLIAPIKSALFSPGDDS